MDNSKVEKAIEKRLEFRSLLISQFPGTEKAFDAETDLKRSWIAMREALDNIVQCFDAARHEGGFDPLVDEECRLAVIERRLLHDVEDKAKSALQLAQQAHDALP